MRNTTMAALLALAAGTAGAQAIYRCGNSYGDEACPGANTVAPMRAPSAEQAAAARRETEREMKLATTMEAARLREEAKPVATYIPPEKADTPERKPEIFSAKLPGDRKKPQKAKAPKQAKKKAAKQA